MADKPAPKTTTVYHPHFSDVSEEVSADRAADWHDAGWLKEPRKDAK